jgi:hypothetical protein
MKDRSSFPHDPFTFPALEWGISRKEKSMNEENGSQTGVRKAAWTSWKWVFPTVVAMLAVLIVGGFLLGPLSVVNAAPTEVTPLSSTMGMHQAHHVATVGPSVAPVPAPVNPEQAAPAVGVEPPQTCQHQDLTLQQACQEAMDKMDPAQREKVQGAMATLDGSKMDVMMNGLDSAQMAQMMMAMDSTEMQTMMKNLDPAEMDEMMNDCGRTRSAMSTSTTWMGHMDPDEMKAIMGD